jgi:hypothetical protein
MKAFKEFHFAHIFYPRACMALAAREEWLTNFMEGRLKTVDKQETDRTQAGGWKAGDSS